jgi:hypothetical protein
LHGNCNVKFNMVLQEIFNQITIEESTVSPEPDLFNMIREFLHHLFQKCNRMIGGVVFTASQNPAKIVPCFTNKTQQRMIALSSLLFRVVSSPAPLLISINRRNMRVQIKSDDFETFQSFPKPHHQIRIDRPNLPGYRYFQTTQKATDRRLDGEVKKTNQFLKNSIRFKGFHMRGSRISQKNAIKTTDQYLGNAVFALPSILDDDSSAKGIFYVVFLKKSPYQPTATKPGQIFAGEFFLNLANFILEIGLFLRYSPFHHLSASFIVLGFRSQPHYYYKWRHFTS